MKKDTTRQVIVVIATILTIVVNGLASSLPLNGVTTGEISDQFAVYFVPAGYVFSIWGVIYLGLLGYTVYQALPAQRENAKLRRIGYFYVGASLANTVWLFLWHYQLFALTVPVMLALLGMLIVVYLRLEIGQQSVTAAQRWLVNIPFSIYLGWITVATIANVTSLLEYWEWNGWGIYPEYWAVIMLVVGALVAAAVSITRGDIAYIAVIVWAFAGIAVKHADTSLVAITAWVAAAAVALTLLVGVPRAKKRR
jgi:hypothetical protein